MRGLKGCLSSGVTSYDTGWRNEDEAWSGIWRRLRTHGASRALKGRWWGWYSCRQQLTAALRQRQWEVGVASSSCRHFGLRC